MSSFPFFILLLFYSLVAGHTITVSSTQWVSGASTTQIVSAGMEDQSVLCRGKKKHNQEKIKRLLLLFLFGAAVIMVHGTIKWGMSRDGWI
jgi:hypothetical protein